MSQDYEDEDSMTLTLLTFKFMLMRSFGTSLDARMATVKVELMKDDDLMEKNDFELLLSKSRVWFNDVMSNSLLFSVNNAYGFGCIFKDGIQEATNYPMITPGEPTDDMIAMLIQAKLNSFCEGIPATFGVVELNTVKPPMDDITTIYTGWAYDDLPTMKDWVGEVAYHTAPWWARNDGSTIDLHPDPEDTELTPPEQGYDMSYLNERYATKSAQILTHQAFNPKVIECNDNPKD